jgi:hypothetical protein
MVNRKKVLQLLWKDKCTVYAVENVKNEQNKRMEQVERVLFTDEPCKLSFSSLAVTSEADHAPVIVQSVKLFLDNDKEVPAGSKIEVTRLGKTLTYKSSGKPGYFYEHQEIPLEPFERWA